MDNPITNTKQLTNLIYDKLADNDDNEQFMAYMSDDMVCAANDGVIGILVGDKQFKITITKTNEIWKD